MGDKLGSLQDNQKNSYKIVNESGEDRVAQRVYVHGGTIIVDSILTEVEVINDVGNPIPVSFDASGLATEAKQDVGNASLASIDAKLTSPLNVTGSTVALDATTLAALENINVTVQNEIEITNDVGNPIPISASSLPLPTGASTSSNQTTANASLASIDGKLVNGNDIGDVTINNAAGASAVNIQDGGNSITVDGTITANQGGTWNINNISGTISLPTGASTSALQTSGNASLSSINGKINTSTSSPLSNDSGIIVRPVSVEYPTFSASDFDIVVGNNKSMLAIQNTGTSIVRIREVWIINDRTTAVTGVAGEFQVNRITSFTGGTTVTPVSYDTVDSLPAGITVATGSTVSGETSILRRGRWSTDEWGAGTSDVESFDHAIQNTEPFWRQTPNGKALTIRQNQGIHVKFATNSTAGAFTIRFIFTTE